MVKITKERAREEHNRKQNLFSEKDIVKILGRKGRLWSIISRVGSFSSYITDFKLLLSMLDDFYHKRYRAVPWFIISSVGATLLYIITPVDMIPDFIPFMGFIDDVAIFSICLNLVRKELVKYESWKQSEG
jgi:uncharacterized membrane protein YkvA (DUF1232 family)